MKKCKSTLRFSFIMMLLSVGMAAPWNLMGEPAPAAKTRVIVCELQHMVGDISLEKVASSVSSSLILTLEQFNTYEVSYTADTTVTDSEETLVAFAERNLANYIVFGSVSRTTTGDFVISVSLFNFLQRKITHRETSLPVGLFEVFSVSDQVILSFLEKMTGVPIAYGYLSLPQEADFTVLVDGRKVQSGTGERVLRVIAGKHEIVLSRSGLALDSLPRSVNVTEGSRFELVYDNEVFGSGVFLLERYMSIDGSTTFVPDEIPSTITTRMDGKNLAPGQESVTPGPHQLSLTTPDFTVAKQITITAGMDHRISPVLFVIPEFSVKLKEKKAQWNGIEPVFETGKPHGFKGDSTYGIKRLYLCHDKKYFYWRIDYAGKNPVQYMPDTVKLGVVSGITMVGTPAVRSREMVLFTQCRVRSRNSILFLQYAPVDYSSMETLDAIQVYNGEDWMEARIEIKLIREHLENPVVIAFRQSSISNITTDPWICDYNYARVLGFFKLPDN